MAGLFSPATLEQIRAASDIVEIIGGYVPLKRAGANFVALCPFHKEKSPSFNVNPHKQIFHCFGCHKGGDVFSFVKEYENIGFGDAVRRLAERAKIPLQFESTPGAQQARHLKETLLQIHEQIAQRWQAALASDAAGQIARDYLAQRGVSAEAVKLFRLGYAPEKWDDTVNWAKSKSFELPLVEQAGLILRKEGADHYYDRFRGRLIFPICDEQGRVVGFSGRVLSGDEKSAKYVNSPETPIFTKGKVIFGLDKSKRALLDRQSAIICEGQLDLIACFMGGVQNVVAPQGTALTADHARILKRYVEEVVLCFDSDNAGQNAAVRSLDSLLAAGLAIRVAVVPAPHDPDTYLKEFGGPAFQQLIDQAEGFFDYFLNRLCATHAIATDKGRTAVLHAMAEAVHKSGDAVTVDKYAQKTALRLGVSVEATRVEFKKISRATRVAAPEHEPEEAALEPATRPSVPEFWLLKLLLLHDDQAGWVAAHLLPEWLPHALVRHIVTRRLVAHTADEWHGVAGFLAEFADAPAAANLVTEVLSDPRTAPNAEQVLRDVVLRLRNQHLERQLAALTQIISHPETTEDRRLELLHQQQALREAKRLPLAPLGEA
jgi:DNA primase